MAEKLHACCWDCWTRDGNNYDPKGQVMSLPSPRPIGAREGIFDFDTACCLCKRRTIDRIFVLYDAEANPCGGVVHECIDRLPDGLIGVGAGT